MWTCLGFWVIRIQQENLGPTKIVPPACRCQTSRQCEQYGVCTMYMQCQIPPDLARRSVSYIIHMDFLSGCSDLSDTGHDHRPPSHNSYICCHLYMSTSALIACLLLH